MIELIFVIVILGILAGVAIPKLAATRDDAVITKGKSDVSTIRSSIITARNAQLMSGAGAHYPALDDGTGTTDGDELFNSVLPYPIRSKKETSGSWARVSNCSGKVDTNNLECKYSYRVAQTDVSFDYNQSSGTFDCDHDASGDAGKYCNELTE